MFEFIKLFFRFDFREIDDINEIEQHGQKEYVQRYQLVPVTEQSFNQQIYEQHGARGRSASDSPEAGNLAISNNGAIYVTSQHHGAPDNGNGIRYAASSEVRFEEENYVPARYEYQHGQHHGNPHNAHSGSNEEVKIELVRNQHAIHGKVCI